MTNVRYWGNWTLDFMTKNYEKKNEKEKEENIWKWRSGETFGDEKYIFCGDEKSEEGKGGRNDGRKIFCVEEKKWTRKWKEIFE